ncbi:MAG: DEAD/DEAH box helicase [Candidatus Cloacimonetes bacterium]|nr:DEAD/DEAH box helicase [Candidatus Cloacimonadota bacterium]MDY0229715.1 DEAD/DEAH box helicase [Candidatus Cloacimonadaceae bacterium]
MARLFSKDYHDRSNSWYFNHAVIPLSEGDLWHWHTVDEAGNILLRFFPTLEKRDYFSAWVEVLYDPRSQMIIRYSCAECGQDESCRHYLSLLRYSYHFLSDDILQEDLVQTCDGDTLRGNVSWLNLSHEAALEIEGIYSPESDKIRIYHRAYAGLNMPELLKLLKESDEVSPQIKANYGVLDDYELTLFLWLDAHRAAYSSKGQFWSIYKKLFPDLMGRLESLSRKVLIKETGEELSFAPKGYPLVLRIEPAGQKSFSLSPILVDELSIWYAGYPTWLFFRNRVHKLWLPFRNDVIDKIFSRQMVMGEKDLIYYRSIVHSELSKREIYLDFDASIEMPPIINSEPKSRLYIRPLGEEIMIEGSLIYDDEYEIPLSMLKYFKPLVYTSYKGADPDDKLWFYLPHDLMEKVNQLISELPQPQIDELEQRARLVYAGSAFNDLQTAIFHLSDKDWEIVIDDELSSNFITKIKLEVQLNAQRSEDIDWFSYEVRYQHADLSFTHEELKRYFRSSDEFLHTVDGRLYFISNPEVFQEVEGLISRSQKDKDDVYRARMLNLPYYQRLREENTAFRVMGDEYLENMFRDLHERHLGKPLNLPYHLQTILRSYQKSGVAWMKMLKHYHLNGILADEMGLGKTIQALTMILSAPEDTVSMVICPKTLTYNWAAEIEKFHTNIPYVIVEGNKANRLELLSSPNIRLYLIGYSMVLSDFDLLKTMHFEWIVLDEAQNIKNVSAQRTSAIKKLKSNHRLALSGTPIENNLTELWSIMDFLMPGYLGTLKRFKDLYLSPEDDRAAKLSLHRAVSPFLLRRIKKEVLLELPDKQEQTSWCKMSTVQEKLYLQILDTVQKKLMPESQEDLSYVHILAALTKLRQVCNHPHLANDDVLPELELSAKLELLVELVQDSISAGHKVLVFSQFVKMLHIMRKVFDDREIRYSYLDGRTKDRRKPVEEFETNEDIRLFLISLKTGGTGLNLTAADTVIIYDPWWNPMVENQAIDRAHRIGQTKKVQVFRLITKGTVEEKILALQQNKLDLFNEVIEGGNAALKTMNMDELKQLFIY